MSETLQPPTIPGARFFHKARKIGQGAKARHVVTVTVDPRNGALRETFEADPRELRRFAWSLLAEHDRDEAMAVCAEEGKDLAAISQVKRDRAASGRAVVKKRERLYDPAERVLLGALVRAGETGRSRVVLLALAQGRDAPSVIARLTRDGFIARVDEGAQGTPATYAITERGREVAEALGL